MRCAHLASASALHPASSFLDSWTQRYAHSLRSCLQKPKAVLLASALFFLASLSLAFTLPKELVPQQDSGLFLLRLKTPVGSSLPFTLSKVSQAEAFLHSLPDSQSFFSSVGGYPGGEANTATIFVTLKPRSLRAHSQMQVMDICRNELAKISDLQCIVQNLASRGYSSNSEFPISFDLRGPDRETLKKLSDELTLRLNASGLMTDIHGDERKSMAELLVWPNRDKAAISGVTMKNLAETINTSIGGIRVGKFSEDGHRYDIRISLAKESRAESGVIPGLPIDTAYGQIISLDPLVHLEERPSALTLTRRLREPSLSVFANMAPGHAQEAVLEAGEKIAGEILPEGYHLQRTGASREVRESFATLLFALFLGLLISYMILAAQFNSFGHPLTVLLALPFSVSGALLALWITRQSLNTYSLIGIILLLGIVKKNSILLVDFINQKRSQGVPLEEAVLEASPARFRPILLTSIATLAAAIPPALALGPDAESRVPLAMTVIGGVLVSTLFTLFVVPCAYYLTMPKAARV